MMEIVTFLEYQRKLKTLLDNYEAAKYTLMVEFVNANNPYKVGDIVTDHIGSIRIEKMAYAYNISAAPCAVYAGVELKKDGTPVKRLTIRTVWQSNLIKH